MRRNLRTFPDAEFKPASLVAPLELEKAFTRTAPLEFDLGCGDGSFLTALAAAHPERDFLGVEKMPGRVRTACRRIGDRQLSNARVLQLEISHAVHLLPRRSIDAFYLLFPDPWPKRRHHSRRIVTADFLRAIARALKPDGLVRIKTDQMDYFVAIQKSLREAPQLSANLEDEEPDLPKTTFEKRFLASGASIYWLELRKAGPNR